jgi:hypothetical protein
MFAGGNGDVAPAVDFLEGIFTASAICATAILFSAGHWRSWLIKPDWYGDLFALEECASLHE